MTNKNRNSLKMLIQKVELDKPSPNFTNLVMKHIQPVVKNEVLTYNLLTSVLQRSIIDKPTSNFTPNIMTQVEACDYKTIIDKPIINKKAWYIAVLFLSGVFWIGLLVKIRKPSQNLSSFLLDSGNILNNILSSLNVIPSLYLITIISMSALLLIDYFIKLKAKVLC